MNSSLYLVAGLGKTGHSIARYLRRKNKAFVVFDTRKEFTGLSEFTAEFPGIDVFLGDIPETLYSQITEIICSPGVALDEPSLQKAKALGIPIIGDIECLAREIHAPIIAITGTNGKSTVTTLVGEIVKAAGFRVAVAGNIGVPVLDLLNDVKFDVWVLELSSFQLDLTYSLAPKAATILNVTPDHLDRHHTFEAYRDAKQRVYHQAQTILYHREDQHTFPLLKQDIQQAVLTSFGLDVPAPDHWGLLTDEGKDHLAYGKQRLLPVHDIRLTGLHNWQNVLAACALCAAIGIEFRHMITVLKDFAGLPHRTQWVRTMDGVDWINDSKGTNVGATMSAISGIGAAIHGKIVWIAGGQGKGADFTDLQKLMGDYVRSAILIGEDADKIEQALENTVPIARASTLDAAVTMAKSQAKPQDVVLFSPACASFDMFKDFNHRGDLFAAAVNAL